MSKVWPETYYDEIDDVELVIAPSVEYELRKKSEIDRVRRYYERKAAIESSGHVSYVNCYHDPIKEISHRLKLHELGTLLKLLPYMTRGKNGALIDGKLRMGIEEIAKAIDRKPRATRQIVKTLIGEGVLIAYKDGRKVAYRVNDEYHNIGKTLESQRYTKLYQAKTRASIVNVSIHAAGLLYKMLPYFHFEYYFLCANPDETIREMIVNLTQESLAREIGEDMSVVSRHIRELMRAGFVMRMEAYGASVLVVNPDVMFRKRVRDERADEYSAIFAQAERAGRQAETAAINELPF